MLLLPALFGAAALAAPALPVGCKEESTPTAIIIRCSDATATASMADPGLTLETFTKTVVAGIKAQLGASAQASASTLTLSGKKLDATRYAVGAAFGWLAVVARAKAVLTLGCQARGPLEQAQASCTKLLERLLASDPPSGTEPRPGPLPVIAGRPLGVPKGCAYDGASKISCPEGTLSWVAPAPMPLAKVIGTFFDNTKVEPGSRADWACAVGGVKGQCYEGYTLGPGPRPKLYLLFGEWVSEGQRLYFWCDTFTPLKPKLPPVCAQVFSRSDVPAP